MLEIRKFLKGNPPKDIVKSDDVTKIENKYGDIYYANTMTVNIYNNDIEKGMATTAKTVLNDNDRTGLSYEFVDEKGKKFHGAKYLDGIQYYFRYGEKVKGEFNYPYRGDHYYDKETGALVTGKYFHIRITGIMQIVREIF